MRERGKKRCLSGVTQRIAGRARVTGPPECRFYFFYFAPCTKRAPLAFPGNKTYAHKSIMYTCGCVAPGTLETLTIYNIILYARVYRVIRMSCFLMRVECMREMQKNRISFVRSSKTIIYRAFTREIILQQCLLYAVHRQYIYAAIYRRTFSKIKTYFENFKA